MYIYIERERYGEGRRGQERGDYPKWLVLIRTYIYIALIYSEQQNYIIRHRTDIAKCFRPSLDYSACLDPNISSMIQYVLTADYPVGTG